MSSRREKVRVAGHLQGMGHSVPCTVFAEKAIISSVPEDLPDGVYKLTFDGREISVQRLNGAWVSPVAV